MYVLSVIMPLNLLTTHIVVVNVQAVPKAGLSGCEKSVPPYRPDVILHITGIKRGVTELRSIRR
jgi:hypothetical protein